MRYVKEQKVTQCYHGCPFFKTTGNFMECSHPHFDEKVKEDAYSRLIITQDNSRGRVPDECPLHNDVNGTTEVVVKVSLNTDNE